MQAVRQQRLQHALHAFDGADAPPPVTEQHASAGGRPLHRNVLRGAREATSAGRRIEAWDGLPSSPQHPAARVASISSSPGDSIDILPGDSVSQQNVAPDPQARPSPAHTHCMLVFGDH